MSGFIKRIAQIGVLFLIVFLCISIITYGFFPGVYQNSLMKGLAIQYHALHNGSDEERKVIMVGGSNIAFSVDSDYLGELLGMPVYNLGVHVGTGMVYPFELAESEIEPGDIVVFPYENFEGDNYGMNLINMTIENESDMLLPFISRHPGEIVRSAGPAACIKLFQAVHNAVKDLADRPQNAYDSRSFDTDTGNFIFDKPETIIKEGDLHDPAPFRLDEQDQSGIAYLNDFSEKCRKKGARLLITWPPQWEGKNPSYVDTEQKSEIEGLKEILDAPVISDRSEYCFSENELYDSPAHLNNKGTERYAELLAKDIQKALLEE